MQAHLCITIVFHGIVKILTNMCRLLPKNLLISDIVDIVEVYVLFFF